MERIVTDIARRSVYVWPLPELVYEAYSNLFHNLLVAGVAGATHPRSLQEKARG